MRNNFDASVLVGKSIDEARDIAGWSGKTIRITQEDGKTYVITCDMDFDRIDVHVENGIITKLS